MKENITANDVLAFVLEVAALVLWGLWAASLAKTTFWRWGLGLLASAALIALWALFFARTASFRPPLIWLALGKLLLLLPPGLLYFRGRLLQSLVYAGLVVLHLVVGFLQKAL